MWVVLVADTDLFGTESLSGTLAEAEVVGPFPTADAAIDWAILEARYICQVMPVEYRDPS